MKKKKTCSFARARLLYVQKQIYARHSHQRKTTWKRAQAYLTNIYEHILKKCTQTNNTTYIHIKDIRKIIKTNHK